MEIVVLSHEEVEELLPMNECIELMSEALRGARQKRSAQSPALRHQASANGSLSGPHAGLPRRWEPGLRAQGSVHLSGESEARARRSPGSSTATTAPRREELLGVFNASAITAIRTAAVSGVATKILARDGAKDLAIVGTGVQAKAHLEAMASVASFERARVASRQPENAERFAASLKGRVSFPIEPAKDVASAVRDADVIVTATNSREPVLKREWLKQGAHINAVGSSIPAAREIDTATMVAATLFVDRRESTLNESGDYLFAAKEGAIGPAHIRAEIGELLIGEQLGRSFPEEITLFKSLGLAVEDLASAQFLYKMALAKGVGGRVRF